MDTADGTLDWTTETVTGSNDHEARLYVLSPGARTPTLAFWGIGGYVTSSRLGSLSLVELNKNAKKPK